MRILAIILALCFAAVPASAAKLAFVLGNAAYAELTDLQNTQADAEAYADAFGALGFKVSHHADLSLDATLEALDRFLTAVAPGDEVVVVYSGHGWSDGATNYLIPTDAPKQGSDRILKRRSVALRNGLNGVLDELEAAGVILTVAIIDACRNNPFDPPAGRKSFGMSRGLAPVKAATGTFVIFSAGEGQEALDRLPNDPPGTRLSVFTRTFLPHLKRGIFLEDAISQAQVETATLAMTLEGHLQHPAYYDQTLGDTCLTGDCPAPAGNQPEAQAICKLLYDEAKGDPSCFAFDGFLAQCPDHAFAGNAAAYLRRNCDTAPAEQSASLDTASRPEPQRSVPDFSDAPQVVRIGTLLGFTGPIETLTGPMGDAVDAAVAEANAAGNFLGGARVETRRGDSTCIDAAAAIAAAERLIDSDGVRGIVGADCSGVSSAVLDNVASKRGIVMISPSATSPALTGASDLFFRVVPSDARFGELLAEVLLDRDIRRVAVTWVNNDYGKGQSAAFEAAYATAGGTVIRSLPHENDASGFAGVIENLANTGASELVIFGYADQGGGTLVRQAAELQAFGRYHLSDGMYSSALTGSAGTSLDGSLLLVPGRFAAGMDGFKAVAGASLDDKVFAPESYDAAAVLLLAMQAAGSDDPADYKAFIKDVANAPGLRILPGDLKTAFRVLAEGGQVDYAGASDVEFLEGGDARGTYEENMIADGRFEVVQYR